MMSVIWNATELFYQGESEELIQHFAKMSPLERLGQPEVMPNVVAFLCRRAAGSTGKRFASMAVSSDRLFKLDGPEAMWVTLLGAP